MPESPIILAYFAQSADHNYLDSLKWELKEIKKSCEDSNNIDINFYSRDEQESTVDQIGTDIEKYNKRVLIFHYSGHASDSEIFLQENVGDSDGLAKLLGECCKNIKLVFLNGCSTSKQVDALLKNGIKVVIATKYPVKDRYAKEFSKLFYQYLFGGHTIRESFKKALLQFQLDTKPKALLPERLKKDSFEANEDILEIVDVNRGGIKTTIEDKDLWKIFVSKEGDQIVNEKYWSGNRTNNNRVDYEKAYTCGRNKNARLFRNYFNCNKDKRNVQHYFTIDEDFKSLEGLSIKSVYENITNGRSSDSNPDWHYPCDPNFSDFRNKIIKLDQQDVTYEEIVEKIYNGLSGSLDESSSLKKQNHFKDLYEINPVKINKYVIVFISIFENDFFHIIGGIKKFISESSKFDEDNKAYKVKFLFFWHITSEKEIQRKNYFFFNFFSKEKTSVRERIIKSFSNSSYSINPVYIENQAEEIDLEKSRVCILHQHFYPLPIPEPIDVEDWVINNGFTNTYLDEINKNAVKNPRIFQNVKLLENELRSLIDQNRLSRLNR